MVYGLVLFLTTINEKSTIFVKEFLTPTEYDYSKTKEDY